MGREGKFPPINRDSEGSSQCICLGAGSSVSSSLLTENTLKYPDFNPLLLRMG